MPTDRREFIVLWPEYFDLNCTRSEGRIVPKKLAIEEPTIELIATALQAIGLEAKIETNKSYSRFWWKRRGRVLVKKTMKKTELIKKIAEQMKIQSK